MEIIETEKEDEVKLRYRPFTALVIDNEKVEKVAKNVGEAYQDREEMTIQHITLKEEYL